MISLSPRYILVATAGLLGLLGGCGGRQAPADSMAPVTLPSATALDALLGGDAAGFDARARLELSWALELAGRFDEAREVVLPAQFFADADLATARAARLYDLADLVVDPGLGEAPSRATLELDLEDVLLDAADEIARGARWRRSFPAPPDEWATWRIAGPFSHLPNVDFDAPFAPDADITLAPRYALPSVELRTVSVLDDPNGITIPSPAGVWFAETGFVVDRDTDVLVAMSTAAAARLWVDDVEALRVSPDESFGSQIRYVRVHVGAGAHRVRLRASTRQATSAWVRVTAPDEVALEYVEAPSALASGTVVADSASAPAFGGSLGDAATDWLAAAELAWLSGDGLAAEELLAAIAGDVSPLAALWTSRMADVAWTLPRDERDELALAAIEGAEPWEPGVALTLELAGAYLDQERVDEARALVDASLVAHSELREVNELAAEIAEYDGHDELSEHHLRVAAAAGGTDCELAGRLVDTMVARGEVVGDAALPAEWLGCDSVVLVQIESYLLPRGEVSEAAERALALLQRDPANRGIFELAYDLAITTGDAASAAAALAIADRHRLDDVDDALLAVDEAQRSGGSTEAALAALFEAAPARIESHLLASLLQAESALADIRVDGLQAIRDHQAAASSYDGNIVYVLDYGASRYFEDGSAISVVHQVIELRTRDALGAYGETGIPSGAVLLTARTIKPDGRVLVPESLQGTSAISMPNLEVGDFIEIEWAERTWQPASGFRGVRSPRFFFKIGDGPLHRSVARYDRPSSWADGEIFDVRNFDGTRDDTEADGVASTVFTVRESMPPNPDDGAGDGAEWLPSVRYSYDYPAEEVARYYSDRVASETVLTPTLEALAEELTAGLDEREAVRAIFRYVVDEIDDSGSFFGQPAAWAPVLGIGDRLALTWTLLEAVGLEPQLVFVRPLANDATPTEMTDDGPYDLTTIRVELGRGDVVWLEPEFDHYPFDYLRTDAQGCEGWIVAGPGAGSRLVTPRWPDSAEVSRISVEIAVDEAGDAQVVVTEHVPTTSASGLRSYLEAIDDRTMIERALENAMSASFPSVSLASFEVVGELEPDAPLSLAYSFESRGFADVIGGSVVVDDTILGRPLAARYASWPSRERELLVGYGVREVVTITVVGPDGAEAGSLPAPVVLEHGASSYHQRVEADGNRVVATRTIDVAPQRVAAEDYAEFAQFLLDMQPSMRLRFVFELP